MRYCLDLDNTICITPKNEYEKSTIIEKAKNLINKLYDNGNYIIINTARGASSGIDWTDFTKKQLTDWGVKYNELVTNKKPNADVFIDDKNMSIEEWYNSDKFSKGFIAGTFDIVHNGYIKFFEFAKEHCNKLMVAIHEDPSLEKNEKSKPIHTLEERMEILKSIKHIDEILIYQTEEDLHELIRLMKPNVRFLDESYKNKKITGEKLCPIIYHERKHDYSYTNLRNKILGSDALTNKINQIILDLVEKDNENIDLPNPLPSEILINSFMDTAISNITVKDGLILEFGVYQGRTINYIALKFPNNTIYGFDSFEGLPEEWNDKNPKGIYTLNGNLPKVEKNVELIKGWFNETLPSFINDHKSPISLLHVDCDIYSSTACVLESLKDQIVDGTVVIFDEIWKYPNYKEHEIKAFAEFLLKYNFKYECIRTLKSRYAKGIFILKK
jgi:cytidyltransferase-like protein